MKKTLAITIAFLLLVGSFGVAPPLIADEIWSIDTSIRTTGMRPHLFYYGNVEASTGQLYTSEVDHSVVVSGSPFQFTRYYNSLLMGSNLSFGEGWSSILDMRLIDEKYFVRADGAIINLDEKGYPELDDEGRVVGTDFICEFNENGIPTEYRVFGASGYITYEFKSRGERITEVLFDGKRIYKIGWRDGYVSTVTDLINRKTSYTYAHGRLIKVSSKDKIITNFRYDSKGRMTVTKRDIDDIETIIEYDDEGMVSGIQMARDIVKPILTVTYDDAENSVQFQDYSGSAVTVILDDEGRPEIVLDQYFMPTKFEYNKMDKIISITDALLNETKFEYDSASNLMKTTDTLRNVETIEWDIMGERPVMVGITDKLGAETLFGYDGDGLPIKITDALDSVWENIYEDGLLVSSKDPMDSEWKFEYDQMGNIETETLPTGDTHEYERDEAGRLFSRTASNGATTSYEYDIMDRVTKTTDAMGNITEYEYDKWGNIVKTKAPNGSETESIYDDNGQLVTSKDAEGTETFFKYDNEGNHVKTIDKRGTAHVTEVDEMGNIVSSFDSEGMQESYEYDELGRMVRMTGRWGAVYEYEYDVLSRLTKIIDPFDVETEFTYDPAGNMLSKEIDGNLVSEFEYDILGRLKSESYPPDGTYTYTYDKLGRMITIIDPIGGEETLEYNTLGDITKNCDTDGNCFEYIWGCCGDLLKVTNPEGSTRSYAYDLLHNRISETDEEGFKTETEYDELNRVTQISNPDGTNLKYAYDKLGHLNSITNAQGNKWKFDYGKAGDLVKTTDPEGNIWKREYDEFGQLVSEESPEGGVSAYEYHNGLLVKMTDPDGVISSFSYDKLGRLYRTSIGGTTVEERIYDTLGRVARTKIADVETRYSYDIQGRIAGVSTSGREENYFYDKLGRVFAVSRGGEVSYAHYKGSNPQPFAITNPAGDSIFTQYDSMGRTKIITRSSGLTSWFNYSKRGLATKVYHQGQGLVETGYDSMGRPLKVIDGNGRTTEFDYENGQLVKMKGEDKTITYKYDKLGRKKTIGFDGDGELLANHFKYNKTGRLEEIETVFRNAEAKIEKEYFPSGRLKAMKYPDDVYVSYNYNDKGMLSEIILPYGKATYSYSNNLLLDTVTLPGDITQELKYTADGRVKSANWSEVNLDFGYTWDDDSGRLAKKSTPTGSETFEYDEAGKLTSWDTSNDSLELQYENGQLAGVDDFDLLHLDSKLAGFGDTSLSYDRSGRLIRKGDTAFDYDCFGQLAGISTQDEIHEIELAGMGLARFDDSLFLSEVDTPLIRMGEDGGIEDIYIFDPSGSPLATVGDETIFHLDDGIGNIVATATHSGLENTFNFNPFGEHLEDADWSSPFRWKGYLYLPDVELYHLGARQFDPEIMSFTSFDPAYPALTIDDPFAFAGWDPVNGYEILGLTATPCNWMEARYPGTGQSWTSQDGIGNETDCNEFCKDKIKNGSMIAAVKSYINNSSANAGHEFESNNYIFKIHIKKECLEGTRRAMANQIAINDAFGDAITNLNSTITKFESWRDKIRARLADGLNQLCQELLCDWLTMGLSGMIGGSTGQIIGIAEELNGYIGDIGDYTDLVNSDPEDIPDRVLSIAIGKIPYIGGMLSSIRGAFKEDANLRSALLNINNAISALRNIGTHLRNQKKDANNQAEHDVCMKMCEEIKAALSDPDCIDCSNATSPPNNPSNRPHGLGPLWDDHVPGVLRPTSSDDAIPRPGGQEESDPIHCVRGEILEKIQANGVTYIKIFTGGGKILVIEVDSDTEVLDERGVAILICNFKIGDIIIVCGSRPPDEQPCADRMRADLIRRPAPRDTNPDHHTGPIDPGEEDDPVPPDDPPGDPIPPDDPPDVPDDPDFVDDPDEGEPPPPYNGWGSSSPRLSGGGSPSTCPCTWESYHKDRWNSGISRDPKAGILKYRKHEWTYTFEPKSGIDTSPVMHDTFTVVNAMDGQMVKLSKSGIEVWKFTPDPPVGKPFTPALCIEDEWIFTSTTSGNLIAVDFENGEEVWNTDLGSPAVDSPTHFSAKVFVGAGSDLVCLDSNTGKELWRANLGVTAVGVPAVTSSDRFVIIGNTDGELFCFDVSGKRIWKIYIGKDLGTPVCSFLKIFISAGKTMFGLSENGAELWKIKENSELENPVAISKGHRVVYVAGDKLKIVSEDGKLLSEESAPDRYPGLTGTWLIKPDNPNDHTVTTFNPEIGFPTTHIVGDGEEIEILYPSPIGDDERTWRNAAFCDSSMVFGNEKGEVHYYSGVKTQEIDQEEKKIILKYQQNNDSYWVNDVEKKMDAPAVNRWNRLFLPVRFVGTDIGMKIDWDGVERKVILTSAGGGRIIELWIGKRDAFVTVDGTRNKIQIDANDPNVIPFIESSRTYLPLRFCGDNLGAEDILYDSKTKIATLIYPASILKTLGVISVPE
jgi:RHS repeat-associated protein